MEEQYKRAVSLLNGQLYQHQKKGVSWLISMENLDRGQKVDSFVTKWVWENRYRSFRQYSET